MVSPIFLFFVSLPVAFRIIPMLVPEAYLEPYAWWDARILNVPSDAGQKGWRNMGYWKNTDDFSEAAEALAQRLLDFAAMKPGGDILDIAHGSGESLVLHLASQPPPAHLHALTSLSSDTRLAQNLVVGKFPDVSSQIEWYTSSATFRTGRDLGHPLNPMRGFMGESGGRRRSWEDDENEEVEDGKDLEGESESSSDKKKAGGPPPYDLVFILDAIYHFKPSVPYFLAQVLPVLRPGSGIIAYTDILPPSGINNVLGHLILPPLLSVPARNLVSRPKSVDEYEKLLRRIGYEGVEIQDWSDGVWSGFAANLRSRGGVWKLVAWLVQGAERNGWKFIAVRGRRPALTDVEE